MPRKPRTTPDPHARLFNPLDRQLEARLALATQLARADLVGLLTPTEARTVRRAGGIVRELEDTAGEIANTEDDPRAQVVAHSLAVYQRTINAFWAQAIAADVGIVLARRFARRYPSFVRGLNAQDIDAEANYALRRVCAKLRPNAAPLIAFAQRRIFEHLRVWCMRSASSCEMPESIALEKMPREVRSINYDTATRHDGAGLRLDGNHGGRISDTALKQRLLGSNH